MMKIAFLISIILLGSLSFSQELVVQGVQESEFHFRLQQKIIPFPGINVLTVSFVVPQNFSSQTYQQTVDEINFQSLPMPIRQIEEIDERGNLVKKFEWKSPSAQVNCSISFKAQNSVKLRNLESTAPFPVDEIAPDIKPYLAPTEMIQADHSELKTEAVSLSEGKISQLAVVRSILHFVVDHLRYDLFPEQFDALYAYRSRKGNCQNYSHLAAALMRAIGIPVRIVNGITLEKEYTVQMDDSEYSFDMATGRHSWIEVYFTDVGWIPFDAQQTEFFVSNRYIRIEAGLDNSETIRDGLVKWTQREKSSDNVPQLEEIIESSFTSDRVAFISERKIAGPTKLLLTPPLEIPQIPLVAVAQPESLYRQTPAEIGKIDSMEIDFTKLLYEIPFEYGNMDFPRGFDFLSARFWGSEEGELKRNFIVETAEYVTAKEQYAQMFVLDEPILLKKIGLPLHSFGGNGFLWLEISEDQTGQPGDPAAASRKIPVPHIRIPKGYDWVDFDLSSDGLILSPGKYWFSLNFSGSPIVNWFYTYGKPVGPTEGTRSREIDKEEWSKILSYEFNYRILGLAVKEFKKY
jgi:hypothetical protein